MHDFPLFFPTDLDLRADKREMENLLRNDGKASVRFEF